MGAVEVAAPSGDAAGAAAATGIGHADGAGVHNYLRVIAATGTGHADGAGGHNGFAHNCSRP